jgi:hypothetical protein
MPKSTKHKEPSYATPSSQSEKEDSSEFNRAPRQKNQDRDPVKSAEQTRHIPTKHGAIK